DEHYVGTKQWNYSELGFMSWWYRHLPHFTCLNQDGILNNWWTYIIDYNEGVELARQISACNCDYVMSSTRAEDIQDIDWISIFPNPAYDYLIIKRTDNTRTSLYFEMTNVAGVVAHKFIIGKDISLQEIDLSAISSGMYFLTGRDSYGKILLHKKISIIHH
nr:T9SS type A sorting domain-containing protein [Bacteroidota bacterium]